MKRYRMQPSCGLAIDFTVPVAVRGANVAKFAVDEEPCRKAVAYASMLGVSPSGQLT